MQKKLVLSVLIASLLTACGGSSDNSNSNPQITPPPPRDNNNTPHNSQNPPQPDNPQNPPQQPEPVKSLTADYSTDNDYNWGDDYDGYDTFTLTVDGKTLAKEVRGEKKQTLDLTAVPLGFKTLTAENRYTGSNNAEYKSDVTLRSYRGFYAGALA